MKRLFLSILVTLGCQFSLSTDATAKAVELTLAQRAAISFVEHSSIDEVFDYLERTIPSRSKPTPDSPLVPMDVLNATLKNPGFLPKHLGHLLELAQIAIDHNYKLNGLRIVMYEKFIRESVIKNLKDDTWSEGIADELNHEMGVKFDLAQSNRNNLSREDLDSYAKLLGFAAFRKAEPEYFGRVMLLAQIGSPSEITSFKLGAMMSAGYAMVPKTTTSETAARQSAYWKWLIKRTPSIERIYPAASALVALESRDFGDGKGTPWTIADVAEKFNTVFKAGDRRDAELALALLEKKMPLAATHGRKKNPDFAELLHNSSFKQTLITAEDRFPDLANRIHAIQDQIVEIDAGIVALRLDRIRETRLEAGLQVRKFLGIRTCRDVFSL